MSTSDAFELQPVVVRPKQEVMNSLMRLENDFATLLLKVKRLGKQSEINISEVKFMYKTRFFAKKFEKCASFEDVLDQLSFGNHISTFNIEAIRLLTYDILPGQELIQILESYENKKDEFLNSTLVQEFLSVVIEPKIDDPKMAELIIKIPEDSASNRTLKDVEKLAEKAFGDKNYKSFVHLRVEPGSVCIIWWYPRYLTSELKHSVKKLLLIEVGVEKLSIDDETIIINAATQQIMASSAAEQKEGLVMGDSATQSLVVDYAAKQGSSINVDSQDSCPWPDIVPATTIEPIFLTEPDDGMLSEPDDGMLSEPDGMLSEPDSSQHQSLKDLLLNPALSAKQIQGTQPYEQSHQYPVPLASAGPTNSHPSSSPTFIRVAITNLSTEADEDDLIPFLDLNGKLINLALVNDNSSKAATVAYPSLADAQKAVMKWHGSIIYGLPVSVEVIQVETRTPSLPPPPPGFLPGMLPSPFEPIKYPHLYPSYPSYSFPPQPADIMALMPPTLGTLNPPYMSYSMMQPQHNFAKMPPSVNYPTLMPQSANSFPTMQPITGMPRVQRKSVQRRISLRLYEFTKTTTEGKDFERNGGSLQYSESDGCLLISADPLETAELFANGVVNRLCERQLPLSLKQLTQLAECDPNRPSQFDELCSPFTTNPNVKIVLSVEYGQGKEPAVTFVGLTEAVNSAYQHFMGSLLKEFEMNK